MQQKVGANGIDKVGSAYQILDRSSGDGPLVEAPSIAKLPDGRYVLFFSSNCFYTIDYDVTYAIADSQYFPVNVQIVHVLTRNSNQAFPVLTPSTAHCSSRRARTASGHPAAPASPPTGSTCSSMRTSLPAPASAGPGVPPSPGTATLQMPRHREDERRHNYEFPVSILMFTPSIS